MPLTTIRCRILGQAEIHTRGIRLTPESELQFGLALYFCAQAGREIPRDELASLFWPKHDVEAGRHCLRQAIYRLRVLGVGVRSGARASVLDTEVVDADFAPAVAEDARAAAFLQLDDVSILPGYAPRFSRPFSHWVEDFRGEISSRMRRGLVRAISEMRARGRYADVERLCRFCLRLDPLNEEATLALAESVALAGSKAEAVGLIERYEGEVGPYRSDLRLSASLLRERISDRLIRRNQASVELPMVGREQDVERVMTAFQRLRGNRAVSYVITGPAGVGKTRLACECCRMAELQGARLLTISTQPSSRTQALFAVAELVDGLLQTPGAIGCAPAAFECLRGISSPFSVRDSGLSPETEGEARFAMVRWSILDVLDAILSEGPLVIHIDDAHQIDEQSLRILQDALRTHEKRPLLLLFTMRKPDQSDIDRFSSLNGISVRHELLPLSDLSCEQLVTRFCSTREESVDDAIRHRIIHLSGGNPFFLVELLKHRSELLSDDLPITVQALLDDRVSRLTPSALTLLRAAAVLGLSSSVERLQRVLERSTTDIIDAITELHAAGMLSTADSGAVCRHDTIRETVLERTPTAARVLLHRRAARVIGLEALKERGVALLWESVHHWRRAGAGKSGVHLTLLLARRLLSLGLANDALKILAELHEGGSLNSRQRRLALQGQAKAARMLRDWAKLKEVVSQWHRSFDAEGRVLAKHSKMELLDFEAQYNDYTTFASLPPRIDACVSSTSASIAHRLSAAALSMIRADNDGDEYLARRVYAAIENLRPEDKRERIAWLTTNSVFHAAFGDVQRMPSLLGQLADEALAVRHPVQRSIYARRAAFGLARYGNATRARHLLTECLEVFERLELRREASLCVEELGLLALYEDAFEEALSWADKSRAIHDVSADPFPKAVEFELRAFLAFEVNDPSIYPKFQMPDDVAAAISRSKRGKEMFLAACLTRFLVDRDARSLRDHLVPLLQLYEEMKNRGYQDQVVSIISAAMIETAQECEASVLVNDYFGLYRRELRPPSGRLLEFTTRFNSGFPTPGA